MNSYVTVEPEYIRRLNGRALLRHSYNEHGLRCVLR